MTGPLIDQREQIRDAIDIVDLVERYVPLRRQGANFVGRCPWHDDSRPSLQVNPQRQTFKCWVCNIGGDIFSFVMKVENVDFKEALQILADIAGIELIKRKKTFRSKDGGNVPYRKSGEFSALKNASITRTTPDDANDPNALLDATYLNSREDFVDAPEISPQSAQDSQNTQNTQNLQNNQTTQGAQKRQPAFVPTEITKALLYRATEWLAGKYRDEFLHSPEAEVARQYIRDRGISDASSERFQIGYAPLDFGATMNWVGGERNRVRILEAAGVLAFREEFDANGRPKARPRFAPTKTLSESERRRYYDRFRGRVVFPIRDVQDRVVAFGGRLLPNTTLKSSAKYLNSPETPIFTKSKMVYGLDAARNAIRKTQKVLVVEGYTDCIMTAQFGFENVVAVLGTALGSEHIRILKRFAGKMILLLDGDEAGQKRAREVLRFFVEQGVDMNVLTLPDDDDPCEFLLEKGPDAFERLLETGTVDAMEHAFRVATTGIDLENDVVGSAKALDSLLEIVALFPERSTASDDPARLRMAKTVQRLSTRFRISDAEIRRQLSEKRQKLRAYSSRYEDRESRYAARDARRDVGSSDGSRSGAAQTSGETFDPAEARIAEFRRDWVYPIASVDGESDDELRARFAPFEKIVWNDERLRPSDLEREYLEIWLTDPDYFERLVEKISFDALRSPITRQLDLLARDFLARGESPTFERMMLRYEDDSIKSFLIELDESASGKKIAEILADSEKRDILLRDLFAGFERERFARETPRQIGRLREIENPQDKLQALLEYRRLQQTKQQNRVGETVFTDENGSDGKNEAPF